MEETQLKDDRVGINLAALTDQIEAKGHVALEGLLFEYDSDKLLPEALPVVEVLASYLKLTLAAHFMWLAILMTKATKLITKVCHNVVLLQSSSCLPQVMALKLNSLKLWVWRACAHCQQ